MMEVNGKRKRGRPTLTWRMQVEESVKKVGLNIEGAGDQTDGRCESNCGGGEVYPATFGNEKTGLELDRSLQQNILAD